MSTYIENLKSYLAKQPVKYGFQDMDSLLELLCYWYTEANPIENSVIRYQFMELDHITERLTVAENDQLGNLTCKLCTEYSRRSFSEGMHLGLRLAAELAEYFEA